MFSTSGFQKGAIEYADAHGIALFQVKKGSTSRIAKAEGSSLPGELEFSSWRTQSDGVQSLLDPINTRDFSKELFPMQKLREPVGE